MTYLYWLLTAFMVVFFILRFKSRYARYRAGTNAPPIVMDPEEADSVEYDYTASYQKKRLLTNEESDAYLKIKEITDQMGMYLFAKVRLCDLIEPKQDDEHFLGAERKIQSERIDFVVCDGALAPKTIIELDDGGKSQNERDEFVDAALQAAELKVIRVNAINPDELADLLAE